MKPHVEKRVDELVGYVAAASHAGAAARQPEDALAFAAGGLHVLHELGLISGDEFDAALTRAQAAAGGGDAPPLAG